MLRRSPSASPNRPQPTVNVVPASPASVRSIGSARSSSRDQRSSRQCEGRSAVDVFRSHQQEASLLLDQLRSAIVSHRQSKPGPAPPPLELSIGSSSTNVSPTQPLPRNQADARSVTPLSATVDGQNTHQLALEEPQPPPVFSSVYSLISGSNPWERAPYTGQSNGRSPFLARIARQQRPSSVAGLGMTQRSVPQQVVVQPVRPSGVGREATERPPSSLRKVAKEPHTLSHESAELVNPPTRESRGFMPVPAPALPLRAKPLPGVESATVATARISTRQHIVTPSRSVTPLRSSFTPSYSTPVMSYATPPQVPLQSTRIPSDGGSYAVIHATPKRRQEVCSQDAGTQTNPPVEIIREYPADVRIPRTVQPLSPHIGSQPRLSDGSGDEECDDATMVSMLSGTRGPVEETEDSLLADVQAVVSRSARLRQVRFVRLSCLRCVLIDVVCAQKLDASLTELSETRLLQSLNCCRAGMAHPPVSTTPPRPTHTLEDLASVSPLPGLAGLWESTAPMKSTQAMADTVAAVFSPFSQKSGASKALGFCMSVPVCMPCTCLFPSRHRPSAVWAAALTKASGGWIHTVGMLVFLFPVSRITCLHVFTPEVFV
jgi:hypothetical protein